MNAVNATVLIQNSLNAYQDTKSSFVPRYPELMMHRYLMTPLGLAGM
jgi:hypothetical protein